MLDALGAVGCLLAMLGTVYILVTNGSLTPNIRRRKIAAGCFVVGWALVAVAALLP